MTEDIERRLAALEAEVHGHRRRAKALRLGALSAAALVFAVGGLRAFADPAAPQACDGRFSSLLYCFGADTPARASEVNSNFNALAALVDSKVGSANATPAGPSSGGTVVIGDQGAANLGLDGDDIYARVDGGVSTLFLQRTGAGNVAIGGAGPNPNAKLQVNGTASATRVETNELVVGGGSVLRKVVTGTIGTCSIPNSAGPGSLVPFGTSFSTPPIVFAMPEEPDASGCTSVRIRSRSTTAFEFQSWTGSTSTACDCIHWIAIGQ
ncbi:MAG: hypothetical protein JNM69_27865 [Archangium sp.]|nr:hypothetical protein [Archangium sp.]